MNNKAEKRLDDALCALQVQKQGNPWCFGRSIPPHRSARAHRMFVVGYERRVWGYRRPFSTATENTALLVHTPLAQILRRPGLN
jgi:hypothetical protein